MGSENTQLNIPKTESFQMPARRDFIKKALVLATAAAATAAVGEGFLKGKSVGQKEALKAVELSPEEKEILQFNRACQKLKEVFVKRWQDLTAKTGDPITPGQLVIKNLLEFFGLCLSTYRYEGESGKASAVNNFTPRADLVAAIGLGHGGDEEIPLLMSLARELGENPLRLKNWSVTASEDTWVDKIYHPSDPRYPSEVSPSVVFNINAGRSELKIKLRPTDGDVFQMAGYEMITREFPI